MTNPTKLSATAKLVVAILICETVGITSGLLTRSEMTTWYITLQKPDWNPPNYLFGPVWTTLYLLMGIALWLVWKGDAPEIQKRRAITMFALQLFLNFWWSILFFKLHSPAFALVDIVLMLLTITLTMLRFAPISRLAAWLLLPYLAWVSFATILNFAIWSLN